MSIVRCRTHIEAYRHRSRASDANELSGRTNRPDLTRFVNARIVETLHLQRSDTLVDVGCGDGTLLRLACHKINRGVGILPTEEEVARVTAELQKIGSNIEILQGVAERTNWSAGSADKVVCNGVIILLESYRVDAALMELARIAKAQALVFVGEIPQSDENIDWNYGDSVVLWLWSIWWRQGVAAFRQRLRQTLRALLSAEPLIITPKKLFYESPSSFIERASQHGLSLLWHGPHLELSTTGETSPSKTRYNYLFRRI